MEVHHVKSSRQKWTHYLFEFLMLFLAVTLGFYSENIREHKVENARIRKYMYSLQGDLQNDLTQLDLFRQRRNEKIAQCDSLVKWLTTRTGDNVLVYFYGRKASRRDYFYPRDEILEQLKSTGSYRLIHSQSIVDTLNAWMLLLKNNQENIEVEETELKDYTQIAAKIFDAAVFEQMTRSSDIALPVEKNPKLFSTDKSLINELCVKLNYWKRTSLTVLTTYDRMKECALDLLKELEADYPLKK